MQNESRVAEQTRNCVFALFLVTAIVVVKNLSTAHKMQNTDNDINAESQAEGQVSVRDQVTQMREKSMLSNAACNVERMSFYQHRNNPMAQSAGVALKQMPDKQNFFRQQRDVRAEYRGETVPMEGADSKDKETNNHSREVIEMHKKAIQPLPSHIKADPVKPTGDVVQEAKSIEARELRRRIMEARKQQLQSKEYTRKPNVFARPISINCREAEREETAKNHTEGNEDAYKVVEQLNASARGYEDTTANGAQKQADRFNARQREAAVAAQQMAAKQE